MAQVEEITETKTEQEHVHTHDEHGHCHDSDQPHTHEHKGEGEELTGEEKPAHKQNRGEKKAKKFMQKLGLKPVPGINRVTLKRNNNSLFVIETPEVMKSPNSDVYIIIGPVKYEDLNQLAANTEAEKFKVEKAVPKEEPKIETVKEEEEEGEEVDESGLTESNIQMVIDHCKVSRKEAVTALKATNDDAVEAILKLTK